jgi:hypothetical protein
MDQFSFNVATDIPSDRYCRKNYYRRVLDQSAISPFIYNKFLAFLFCR